MPINLSKGQKVDLTKGNPGLTKIMVGLGWDVNAFDSGSAFDLDAAAFLVGANGKCPTERDFIFYGNLKHSTGAVEHMGDNLTGEGDGDDEQILVDLSKVPANIERIAFTCDQLSHSGLRRLGACHCSGAQAGEYFQAHSPGYFFNNVGPRLTVG